jgi:hypothetical protein
MFEAGGDPWSISISRMVRAGPETYINPHPILVLARRLPGAFLFGSLRWSARLSQNRRVCWNLGRGRR